MRDLVAAAAGISPLVKQLTTGIKLVSQPKSQSPLFVNYFLMFVSPKWQIGDKEMAYAVCSEPSRLV